MSSPGFETIAPRAPATGSAAVDIAETLARSDELRRVLEGAAVDQAPVLLIVNDPHRSTRTREVLLALAGLSKRWGCKTTWRVLVATGSHRSSEVERVAFEAAMIEGVDLDLKPFVWHDATNPAELTPIGPFRMNRLVAESRWIIPIGSVEPHYFAGVTGPHKTLTIGCLAYRDIERNHEGALDPSSQILRLSGNPVYEGVVEMVAALRAAGKRTCAIAEVVEGDQVMALEAGECLDVVHRLLPVVRATYVHELEAPADLLWLRVPPPLGRSLYQADKALKNNSLAVRDGGGIILEAACEEGIGPDAFLKLLRRAPDYRSALRLLASEGYRLGDHKAVKLRHLSDPSCRGVRIALVSSPAIAREDAVAAGMVPFPSVRDAVQWMRDSAGIEIGRALCIEDAGFTTVAAVQK